MDLYIISLKSNPHVVTETGACVVECKVHKCFMSCAPPRSPLHDARRQEELVAAFGRAMTRGSWQRSCSIRVDVIDFLMFNHSEGFTNRGWYHIQRYNGRTHFDGTVVMKSSSISFICEMAKRSTLVRLDWVANIFSCKQTEAGGDFELFRKNGRLRTLLYDDMRREDKIRLAAAWRRSRFRFKDGEWFHHVTKETSQVRHKLERLRVAREDLELRGGSVVAATGAGKSLIAFMDAMATMYDECGKSLTRLDQIGMVWTCKRIHLLEQSIENFKDHEDRELADFAKRQYEYKIPKLFYYLVCSKQETIIRHTRMQFDG